jgi:hypothetical protein
MGKKNFQAAACQYQSSVGCGIVWGLLVLIVIGLFLAQLFSASPEVVRNS